MLDILVSFWCINILFPSHSNIHIFTQIQSKTLHSLEPNNIFFNFKKIERNMKILKEIYFIYM